jgi:hypothetical protein
MKNCMEGSLPLLEVLRKPRIFQGQSIFHCHLQIPHRLASHHHRPHCSQPQSSDGLLLQQQGLARAMAM